MSIFGKIKDAIFGHPARAQTPPTAQPNPEQPPARVDPKGAAPSMATEAVDVEAELAVRASGQHLNWRTSIVDLMKLLEIDPSLENRKALAKELGYTGELNGSAEMNLWLHKATMRELAANGGKVPAEMLD